MKAKGSYAAVSVEYVAAQLATNEAVVVDARPKKIKVDYKARFRYFSSLESHRNESP